MVMIVDHHVGGSGNDRHRLEPRLSQQAQNDGNAFARLGIELIFLISLGASRIGNAAPTHPLDIGFEFS